MYKVEFSADGISMRGDRFVDFVTSLRVYKIYTVEYTIGDNRLLRMPSCVFLREFNCVC